MREIFASDFGENEILKKGVAQLDLLDFDRQKGVEFWLKRNYGVDVDMGYVGNRGEVIGTIDGENKRFDLFRGELGLVLCGGQSGDELRSQVIRFSPANYYSRLGSQMMAQQAREATLRFLSMDLRAEEAGIIGGFQGSGWSRLRNGRRYLAEYEAGVMAIVEGVGGMGVGIQILEEPQVEAEYGSYYLVNAERLIVGVHSKG